MTVTTLEQFGGGVTCSDNSGPWAKMMGAIGSSDAAISLGPGRYTFLSPISATLSGPQQLGLSGCHKGVTQQYFPSSNGLTVNYNSSPWCRFCAKDISIVPGSPAQHIGLSLSLMEPLSSGNPALAATNDLTNIAVGQVNSSGEWSSAILVDGVSNVCYTNVEVYGLGNNPNTVGVVLRGTNTPSVVHNFQSLNASFVGTGIVYGSNVQGVTIGGSNLTGNCNGIWIPPGTGLFQLSISDTQFNTTNWGILDQGPVGGMTLRGCLFLMGAGSCGIGTNSPGPNIIGNELSASGANTNGIVTNSAWAQIADNFCVGLTTGVWLQSNSKSCSVSHNRGDGIANVIVLDQGTGNVLTDNV